MKKQLSFFLNVCLLFSWVAFAGVAAPLDPPSVELDTTKATSLNEVLVTRIPTAGNYLIDNTIKRVTMQGIQSYSIRSMSDLGSVVPNLYIPSYGSRYSSAICLRGMGSRSGGQKVALFVDDVPTMTHTFNRDLYNLVSVDVMSGAESSVLGRNAMGGVINLRTLSAFESPRLELNVKAGSHEYTHAMLRGSHTFNSNNAISLGGFYNRRTGYFTNLFTGEKADTEENAGGALKYQWRDLDSSTKSTLMFTSEVDYTNQGAFPYASVDPVTQKRGEVNFNDPGMYRRLATNQRLNYSRLLSPQSNWAFKVLAGLSSLHDNLKMDMDFSPMPIFSQVQKQKQWAGTLDLLLQDVSLCNVRTEWGISLFADRNAIDVPVTMHPMALAMLVQPGLDVLNKNERIPVLLNVDASKPRVNENAFTKQYRGAFFYTSGKWFLPKDPGWSVTWALRAGYEQQLFDYRSAMSMGVFVSPKAQPDAKQLIEAPVDHSGKGSQGFWEILPKLSLQWDYASRHNDGSLRLTVSRGYKSGGYNEQLMADITTRFVSQALRAKAMKQPFEQKSSAEAVAYMPEHVWNAELMWRSPITDRLHASVSLFASMISGIQVAQFAESGAGRLIANAGEAYNKGLEAQVDYRIYKSLQATLSYGFTDARFSDYFLSTKVKGEEKVVSLKDKHVPYVPEQTASLLLHFNKEINRGFVKTLHGSVDLRAVGKTYWDELNTLSEPFYATLGASLGVDLKNYSVTIWGRNLTNTQYSSFYFVSMGKHFLQKGAPWSIGADFTWRL